MEVLGMIWTSTRRGHLTDKMSASVVQISTLSFLLPSTCYDAPLNLALASTIMLFYGRLRGAIGRIKAPTLLRSLSYPTCRGLTPSPATHFASYRSFSAKSNSTSELFNYTTGRWM
jgi:hypothetical protein